MINVAILSVIRRWHLRDGVSIREIARRQSLPNIENRLDCAPAGFHHVAAPEERGFQRRFKRSKCVRNPVNKNHPLLQEYTNWTRQLWSRVRTFGEFSVNSFLEPSKL